MNFRYTTENKIKSADFKKIKDGEISEYQVKIEFEEECSPSVFSISWEEDHVDMYGFWSSKSFHQHNISPNWWMRTNESKTASGMPLVCIYNKANQNRVTIALSDPASPVKMKAGVVEETAKVRFQIDMFAQICSKMKSYEVVIRLDRRNVPFYKAVISVRDWWTGLGYKSAYAPKEASLPMYSCWYSFHQKTIPEEIIYECKIAKELGMETVIVDDGWQTDDNNRGYAFCGDWEVCEKKIPDMKRFVDEIHKIGMKFMLWFSVPFVGFESKSYERFKGMYLNTRETRNTAVLDPRFPVVRKFLIDIYVSHVKKYGYDGLKLDFIDSFNLDESSPTNYDDMDTVSVEEGLQKLLTEATTELKKINPEILIEFRQYYVGPIVSQFGNLLRVGDCPNDAIANRICSLDLRITSDTVPVHSDMLMWNKNDTNESVMYQLLAIMFAVPQISVRFDNITAEHKRLLKSYLKFWTEHRDILLSGELTLNGVDADYTFAKSQKDGQSVAVLYQNEVVSIENGEKSCIFNSTGTDGIYIESEAEREYELYNLFGEKYAQGKLPIGISKIPLGNCEMIKIW
ncbi:MAG: alpha-galactosidase [Clostridia bacterium]|nr:alpha-galactosidase [Clostridia bacterium]